MENISAHQIIIGIRDWRCYIDSVGDIFSDQIRQVSRLQYSQQLFFASAKIDILEVDGPDK